MDPEPRNAGRAAGFIFSTYSVRVNTGRVVLVLFFSFIVQKAFVDTPLRQRAIGVFTDRAHIIHSQDF